jgi:hypothetical protein
LKGACQHCLLDNFNLYLACNVSDWQVRLM